MSGEYDVQSVEARVDLVVEMAERQRAFLEQQFTGTPPGYESPDNETFAAWFEAKVAESPPVPMVMPDGREVVTSPWVAALSFADGGMALVSRYDRIRGGANNG